LGAALKVESDAEAEESCLRWVGGQLSMRAVDSNLDLLTLETLSLSPAQNGGHLRLVVETKPRK
jgi:hypothetical protein